MPTAGETDGRDLAQCAYCVNLAASGRGEARTVARMAGMAQQRRARRGAKPRLTGYSTSSSIFGTPTRPSTAEAGSRSNGAGKPRCSRLPRVTAPSP